MGKIQTPNQCSHEGCGCEKVEGSEYCSDYCENAESRGLGGNCDCGHSDCG